MATPYDTSDVQADDDGNTYAVDSSTPETDADMTNAMTGPSGGLAHPADPVGTDLRGQNADRFHQDRSERDNIMQQIANATGDRSDALAQQRQAMQEATHRLMMAQMGPDENEKQGRMAVALATPGGPSAVNMATAQAGVGIDQDRRAAEARRDQLLSQYGMSAGQAGVAASQARITQLGQQLKLTQSDEANAAKLAQQNHQLGPNGTMYGDTGKATIDSVQQAANQQAAAEKLKNAIALKAAVQKVNAGQMDAPTIDYLAQQFNLTHQLPAGISRQGLVAPILNRAAALAAQNGDSAGQVIANQQMNKAGQAVLKDYTSGKTYQQLQGVNTAVMHMSTLEPIIDQLGNGDNTGLNALKNTWDAKVMGATAPQNFNAVKSFVAGEIAKAVLPGGGGEREREEIAQAASSASNPQALKQVLQSWKTLLAGKTDYTRQNWDMGTGGRYGDFSRFLLPQTQAALGYKPTAAAPAVRPGQTAPHPVLNDPTYLKYAPKPATSPAT